MHINCLAQTCIPKTNPWKSIPKLVKKRKPRSFSRRPMEIDFQLVFYGCKKRGTGHRIPDLVLLNIKIKKSRPTTSPNISKRRLGPRSETLPRDPSTRTSATGSGIRQHYLHYKHARIDMFSHSVRAVACGDLGHATACERVDPRTYVYQRVNACNGLHKAC